MYKMAWKKNDFYLLNSIHLPDLPLEKIKF